MTATPTRRTASAHACIYCTTIKGGDSFNSDHVVSRGLGSFEQNWTLDCVCTECNGELGKQLEDRFFRGSYEGFLRYEQMLRRKGANVHLERVDLRLAQPASWRGVIVTMHSRDDGVAVLLPAQLGFRRAPDEPWRCISIDRLGDAPDPEALFPPFARRKGVQVAVFADSEADEARAQRALDRFGFRLALEGRGGSPATTDSMVLVEVRAVFDEVARRTIAKIAFNYTAYQLGAEFVLRREFDSIRRYVRHGDKPTGPPVVRPVTHPMLLDESRDVSFCDDHLVGLKWDAGDRDIECHVSPFNTTRYVVNIAREYAGIFRPDLSRGHRFDWRRHRIEPLQVTRLRTPPPAVGRIKKGMF